MVTISQYLKESYAELKKVVWPTRKQAFEHTLAVVGISLAVAGFLGLVDYLLTTGLQQIFIK
jgi:preprotein translocase subunit SecE